MPGSGRIPSSEITPPDAYFNRRMLIRAAAPRDRTALELAEALGVAIDYDCRAGICGQRKIRLVSGRVVMDAEGALLPIDRANDLILSCQARCVDQVVVEA